MKMITAESTIGSQRAERGTMHSLLEVKGRIHDFAREATLVGGNGQEAKLRGFEVSRFQRFKVSRIHARCGLSDFDLSTYLGLSAWVRIFETLKP
jgi:hypothetical protein